MTTYALTREQAWKSLPIWKRNILVERYGCYIPDQSIIDALLWTERRDPEERTPAKKGRKS